MANIIDYLHWRGDLPVCPTAPFNDLDSVCLARFSYLPLYELSLSADETVASIRDKSLTLEDDSFRRQDRELLTLMADSTRFSGFAVTDYVKENDPEEEKQFAAVTLHLSDSELAISFCGTDSTVYGWKEDFNMSFMEEVPAQSAALEYAKRIFTRYPDKKVRLIGHSKGGNLAVYVFYMLSPQEQNRVIHVKNFDGPGFHDDFLDEVARPTLLNRIFTFLPQDSVFGRILERRESYTIVNSTEQGVNQHDVYSWTVHPTSLEEAEGLSDYSNIIATVISKVMYQNSLENRKKYIDGVYNIVTATSATTTAEFREGFPSNIPTLLKTRNEMSSEEKTLLDQITREFGSAFAETTAKTQGEKLSHLVQDIGSRITRKSDEEKNNE